MTPHLLSRPFSSTTILPARWSSTYSNSPMYPCFIIRERNLMTTLDAGLRSTCRLPRFSALYMVLSASPRTLMRTIFAGLAAATAASLGRKREEEFAPTLSTFRRPTVLKGPFRRSAP
ncbi:hypothetical protein Vretifemale_2658 [Volvox reticuliferus]|nr:hypothetical protein Vretifemale_2658 [Volvox reticuliferus]